MLENLRWCRGAKYSIQDRRYEGRSVRMVVANLGLNIANYVLKSNQS
jgi:hypothetical protein